MRYSDLVDSIKEITSVVALVPEKFQERCFEVLLKHLVEEMESSAMPHAEKPPQKASPSESPIPLNASLRVFMKKHEIALLQIESIVMFENNEVHFIKEPQVEKIAAAQMEWALLLALKSAIVKSAFVVDPEDVRSICKEKGIYDVANFAATFLQKGNAPLFRGEMKAQGDPQQLSDQGMVELGALIKRLAV